MPFGGGSAMFMKEEFVRLAQVEGTNVSELCRRFGVSRPTGHKWLARYLQAGSAGMSLPA
jgi:transposase-like protein